MISESGLVMAWWVVALIGGFVLGIVTMFIVGVLAGKRQRKSSGAEQARLPTSSSSSISRPPVVIDGEQDG